jgi:membrane dipeptidase
MSRALRGILFLALLFAWIPVPGGVAPGEDPALRHARRLLQKAILIDGHNDLPWSIRERKTSPMDVEAVDLTAGAPGGDDIPGLRAGGVGGQFFSVFLPGDLKDGHFARVQLEQIDIARRVIARYPRDLGLALTADDIVRVHASGRIACLIGMEGGHALENSLGALRAYYDLGARYMTLTHNVTLDWADAALDAPKHNGLTPFGREVVREMNRLGMLVDLSHVSPKVMEDALDTSEAPVIFSHSSARALADHPRNVPDAVLRRLPENGGIVMITFVPSFVSPEAAAWWAPLLKRFAAASRPEEMEALKKEHEAEAGPEPRATLAQVADHIEHARDVAGIDHVGIGGDYPAESGAPEGLEDVSKYPYLFAELIRRGWSDGDLSKLAGGNLLRVMRRAEEVSRRLRMERPPSTATIEQLDSATAPSP